MEWQDWDADEYADVLAVLVAPDQFHGGIEGQNAMFRRRTLERVGPWDESLYVADLDYFLRAAWAGCRFRYCPGAYTFFQSRPGQMSGDRLAMAWGHRALFAKTLGYVDREPYRSMVARQLGDSLRWLALHDPSLARAEAAGLLASARALDLPVGAQLRNLIAATVVWSPGGRALLRRAAGRVFR
jgi:hypothetical protein